MDNDNIRALCNTGYTGSPARIGMLALKSFVLLLFAVLAPLLLSPVWAGPIFINQEQWERPPEPEPVEIRAIPVTIKNKAKSLREVYTLDLGNGLNVDEAALLAVITHPYIVSVRKKKGLKIPQLINSGLLPPLRIGAYKAGVAGSWLPKDKFQLLKEMADRLSGATVGDRLELESAWLEWQASEAARLSLYRKTNSRKIINVLRQIEKVYKDIYKTTSKTEYKEKYPEMRATARPGYQKMKKAGKSERKALSAGRAELNHALGLPTNIYALLEDDVTLNRPETIPSAKELIQVLSLRRLDFMALRKGISLKKSGFMSYVLSRFNVVQISILAKTKADWLDTAAPGVYITFPLFAERRGVAPLRATTDELLTKNYNHRLKVATLQVSRLVKGLAFITGELVRIDATLPALSKAVDESGDNEKSPVVRLQKKKTFLAVRLLRLRLLRKLMDTGFALEIASGTRIFETPTL